MKGKIKSLDEIKELEKNGELDKKFKIIEIRRCNQKNKKITCNLLVCILALSAVTILTESLEKDDLLSNELLQNVLCTISLLLRGTIIGTAIVELFRKVKYECILGYLENLNFSDKIESKDVLSK